jgi:pimeloyl-ACP methyl ester carboxylesterase
MALSTLPVESRLALVLLHALPFDGSMWAEQGYILPGRTHAPTMYGLGETLSQWASEILRGLSGDRLIVVGNSIGGSCALEMAVLAPERIAALVLIGAKAGHRRDPELRSAALESLRNSGVEAAWDQFWDPLISLSAPSVVRVRARSWATTLDWTTIAKGVDAFHTRPARRDLLPRLRFPVVYISGEHDVAPGPRVMGEQARLAIDGRLIIVPDCGHYVPFEKPAVLNGVLHALIDELA